MAEVMSRDPETEMVLQGLRGLMPSQRSLPSHRVFFWTGFLLGVIMVVFLFLLLRLLVGL